MVLRKSTSFFIPPNISRCSFSICSVGSKDIAWQSKSNPFIGSFSFAAPNKITNLSLGMDNFSLILFGCLLCWGLPDSMMFLRYCFVELYRIAIDLH